MVKPILYVILHINFINIHGMLRMAVLSPCLSSLLVVQPAKR